MQRIKQVLRWLCAAAVVVVVGAVIWNLPEGGHTEVVPADTGEHVGIARADPDVDRQAFEDAQTYEDLKKVKGLHLSDDGG